jgi:hypothetical protein
VVKRLSPVRKYATNNLCCAVLLAAEESVKCRVRRHVTGNNAELKYQEGDKLGCSSEECHSQS